MVSNQIGKYFGHIVQNTPSFATFDRMSRFLSLELTRTQSWIWVLVFGYFCFLFRLDHPVVREWDEAGYGINAWEMSQSGNPWVVTFEGKSDLYNSKPPLGVWLMSISTRIFGVNTYSLRFFSALFSLLLCFFLLEWLALVFKNRRWGLISVMVLMGSIGFTGWHEARSGDFDALVAVFIAVYVLLGFQALNHEKPGYLVGSALFLSLACLTKGVYGLVVLPGLLLYIIRYHKISWLIRQKEFYGGLLLFLILFPGYYVLREFLTPGYFQAVLENEIGERVFLEQHIHQQEIPFYYHTFKLLWFRYQPFILLLPFVIWKIRFEPIGTKKSFLNLVLFVLAGIWCLISFSKTKLVWYDGSLYPFFAILIGWWISEIKNGLAQWVPILLIGIWALVLFNNLKEKDAFPLPVALQEFRTGQGVNDTLVILNSNFELPIRYTLIQDSLAGFRSRRVTNMNQIKSGDRVLIWDSIMLKKVGEQFAITYLGSANGVNRIAINSR